MCGRPAIQTPRESQLAADRGDHSEAVDGWQTVPQVREFRQAMKQIPTATTV